MMMMTKVITVMMMAFLMGMVSQIMSAITIADDDCGGGNGDSDTYYTGNDAD